MLPRIPFPIRKIVSGGQTGADRAALDFAIRHGIPHGGWCPLGRWAENGCIPSRYHLQETPLADPAQRTEWNVRDSDGTIIFSLEPSLKGGSLWTLICARELGRPWLHVHSGLGRAEAVHRIMKFVRTSQIRVINIAGPRE